MKKMKKTLQLLLLATVMVSCNKNTEGNTPQIENEHVKYLKDYESDKFKNNGIRFVEVNGETYWETYYHSAGTRQIYYWKNENNLLVPKYIFEFSYFQELDYYFNDLTNNTIKKGAISQYDEESDLDELTDKLIADLIAGKDLDLNKKAEKTDSEKILFFEDSYGRGTYKLIINGDKCTISYKSDSFESEPEVLDIKNGKIIESKQKTELADLESDEYYKFYNDRLCIFSLEIYEYECCSFNREKSTHSIEDVVELKIEKN